MSNARTIADLAAVTSTATELNALDGITSNVTELNHVDGVTSNVQTQLDSKVGANYTGDVNITGELLVDSYNETFKKVSSVSAVSGFILSGASYDSKSFDVGSQDSSATEGFTFSYDGTKMYAVGTTNDTVYQYTLSTAWDVSTASYASKSFSIASEESSGRGVRFKPDGAKMYVVGNGSDAVHQYSLSTAWDVSTASYDSVSLSLAAEDGTPMGVSFSSDGTKLYMVGSGNDTLYQYNLTTAWDLSTGSYASKSLSVASQDTSPGGVVISNDGTELFVAGYQNDAVYQYNMSTAYDLATASYSSTSFSVASQATVPKDLSFSTNGDKMYVGSVGIVYQYSTGSTTYSTTFDCENANVFEAELEGNTTVVFSNPPASGTPVVSYYQIGSASYSQNFSVASQDTDPRAIRFNSDGTKMFILGATGDDVNEYTLSTGFDVSTASYSQNFSVASEETTPTGMAFNSDGTKMFIVGYIGDDVNEYALTTGFDVSTASYSQNFSVSTNAANPSEITFNSDGTKMFILSAANRDVNEYALTTGFDVSTASYSQNFSVNSEDTAPEGIAFNSDGTKMFVIGRANDTVFEYTLTTGFDLSTASYSSTNFSVATEEIIPYGIALNSNGSKMFVVGADGVDVNEYSISLSVLNDSTAYAMSLKVVQDSGASGYTVTWPTSVDWPAATAPTLTATASAVDQFVFYTYDGGTNWYGFTAGQALG